MHESVRSVHLLTEGRNTAEMPLAAFDMAVADVPGPAVTSAAGRLWKALAAQCTGSLTASGLTARWHPEAAASVAYRLATATAGTRRAAARDALALGTPQVIGGLGLPVLEACWYQAWAAAAAADTPRLLDWLERLPPTGYPARAGLLAARAADLTRDGALGARAAAQLTSCTADPDARALRAVLAGEPADMVAALGEYLGGGRDGAEPASQTAGELHDLSTAMGLVFASRWEAALAAGRELAGRAGLPAIRVEALNIAALCHFKLGELTIALRTLGAALDPEPAAPAAATGLLVNMSVIAAGAGSAAAMPYLARIAGAEPDPAVRAAACGRAIDLWMADPDAQDYPGALRAMVRDALAAGHDDEFHQRLLRFANLTDTAWLAREAPVHSDTYDQVCAEWYWRTRARAATDGCEDDLADIAAVLGELAGQPAPPAWVRTELRTLAGQLDDDVHVDFGTAVDLVPVIETLLDAGVLDLDQRLVLAAQAGAHVAAGAAEHEGIITPECERRLLFETAAEYGVKQAELTETTTEYVGGELARCITVAARTVALAALANWETATKEWNELVNTAPSEAPGSDAVRKAKLRILDDLQCWVTRLGSYCTALNGLPGTEASRDVAGTLSSLVGNWSAELTRLRQFS